MLVSRMLIAFGLSVLVACSVAEIPGGTGGGKDKTPQKEGTTSSAVCAAASTKLEPQDPGKMPKCECKAGGAARCIATSKMPDSLSSQFEKCDADKGACVPDSLIASGGKAPPTCKDHGKDGRCMSMCVPLVAKYAATLLGRGDGDFCPTDERCVPCENPLDGTQTGVCEIGKAPLPACSKTNGGHVGDVKADEQVTCPFSGTPGDPNRFPPCGVGGRCLEAKFVGDPKLASRLARCDQGLCVPEVYVIEKGVHLPQACSSFAGIEGRCLSLLLLDVNAQKEFLQQDSCTNADRCVPCFNPATGEPTGACETVTCDQPRGRGVALQDCCVRGGVPKGKCVPRKDVPASFTSRLNSAGCDGSTEVCAPTDNLDPKTVPVTCATNSGKGVCVSNCVEFNFIEELLLDRGSCRSDQTCVPCRDPATGADTGLPGCN